VIAALGYQETINFSFVDVRLSRTLPVIPAHQTSTNFEPNECDALVPAGIIVAGAEVHLDRKANRVNIFEMAGRVFLRDASVVNSDTTVAGFNQPTVSGWLLVYGPRAEMNWGEPSKCRFLLTSWTCRVVAGASRCGVCTQEHPAMHPGRAYVIVAGHEWVLLGAASAMASGLRIGARAGTFVDLAAVLERHANFQPEQTPA
jgi:phenylalanyl-tRNA synthetase beta chain